MHVNRIEIVSLRHVADTGQFEARFCLHMADLGTGARTNAILIGYSAKQPGDSNDALARRLIADVIRQVERMPEYLLGHETLTYDSDCAELLAA